MDRSLQIALIVGVFAVATVLFEYSENGRYQYSPNGSAGIIVDTRTGEYWTEDGSHFEPREARITVHHPAVDDRTASDDRVNKFMDCIHDAAHKKDARDCLAEQKIDVQPGRSQTTAPDQSSKSPTSH
jgi:hypothetical protein